MSGIMNPQPKESDLMNDIRRARHVIAGLLRQVQQDMTQAQYSMDHPTLWVSYCGKFRVISNDSHTLFLVQSFSGNIWNTFSKHQDWGSIKHKFSGTHTFSDIPDAPPSRHRSFTYFKSGAFPVDGYNSLTFSKAYPE